MPGIFTVHQSIVCFCSHSLRIEISLDVRTRDRFWHYSDCHKQNLGIWSTHWDAYMSTYSKETRRTFLETMYICFLCVPLHEVCCTFFAPNLFRAVIKIFKYFTQSSNCFLKFISWYNFQILFGLRLNSITHVHRHTKLCAIKALTFLSWSLCAANWLSFHIFIFVTLFSVSRMWPHLRHAKQDLHH